MNQALRRTRRSAEMTQAEVARAAGLNRTTYLRIEHGLQEPSVTDAAAIARVLRAPIEALFLTDSVLKCDTAQSA